MLLLRGRGKWDEKQRRYYLLITSHQLKTIKQAHDTFIVQHLE